MTGRAAGRPAGLVPAGPCPPAGLRHGGHARAWHVLGAAILVAVALLTAALVAAATAPAPGGADHILARAAAGGGPGQPVALAATGAGSGGAGLSPSLLVVLACLFAAIFLVTVVVLGVVHPRGQARRLAARVERYGTRQVHAAVTGQMASIAERWVAPLLRFRGAGAKLARRLDLAGIGRTPAEWVLLGGGGGVVLALMMTMLFGNLLAGLVAGGLVAWLGMRLGLTARIGRRRAAFGRQLPDVLQFVAGSLRSGFSLAQGLDAVIREGTQPAASEFARAMAEARIGVELEDAVEVVADRMESADLRWTVVAIRIQREVGGNLAEVLGNTVETMRERAQLRRNVRALSAEGRLSAYILVGLPVVAGAWLFLTRRSYVRPLYTTAPGIVMLTMAVVLVVAGALWMRSMVKVEV